MPSRQLQIQNIPRIARNHAKLVFRKEKNMYGEERYGHVYSISLTRLVFHSDIIDVSHVIVTIKNYAVEWLVPVEINNGVYRAIIPSTLPFRYVVESKISLREVDVLIYHPYNKFLPIPILAKVSYSSFVEHGGSSVNLYEIFTGPTSLYPGDLLEMSGLTPPTTVISKTATHIYANGPSHGLPINGTQYRRIAQESVGVTTITGIRIELSFDNPPIFFIGDTCSLYSIDCPLVNGISGIITFVNSNSIHVDSPSMPSDYTGISDIVWCYPTVPPAMTLFNWNGTVSNNFALWSNPRGVFARYSDSFLFLSIFESYAHRIFPTNRVCVKFNSNQSPAVPETANWVEALKDVYVISTTSTAVYCLTFPIAYSNVGGSSSIQCILETIWLESLTVEYSSNQTVIHYHDENFVKKFEPNEVVRIRPMNENIVEINYDSWYQQLLSGIPISMILPGKIVLPIGYGTSPTLVSRIWQGFISPPIVPPFIETELSVEFKTQ
jgi:hypothetical protein